MRLLLTRSQPEADETASELRERGHEVMVEPMLTIGFAPAPEDLHPDGLIVSSKNGVRALAEWKASKRWHAIPLFAVGDETAEAARAEGFREVKSASGTSEDLAKLVLREFPPGKGRLVYVAAEERSPTLETRLGEAGHEFQTVVAYKATPPAALSEPTATALGEGKVDGVLLFSRRAAETLRSLLGRGPLRAGVGETAVFALSEKTAGGFAGVPVKSIKVAPHADAESLLGLIPDGVST
jgi:uroporphyrinogen-III synthase